MHQGKLNAESLFKLNDMLFNWEKDNLVKTLVAKLFETITIIQQVYLKEEMEGVCFYDYLALLGTLCNQHCWTSEYP